MIREAQPADRAVVESFLLRRVEEAMFPLANLRDHGLGTGGFASDHDHATRYWVCGTEPTGILGLTRGGMLLPVLPKGADANEVRKSLAGLSITGAVGAATRPSQGSARQPVAMSAFNAVLPEIVQIGGVFVPRRLRNRGYARLAVAQHMVEARARGVQRAVLFAASEAAVRAYRAIGFQPAAAISLVLFDGAQRLQP